MEERGAITIVPGDLCICVGGGNIGSDTALLAKAKGAVVVVIDQDPGCKAGRVADSLQRSVDELDLITPGMVELLISDGVAGLIAIMRKRTPKAVIPAMPGHLAALAARSVAAEKGIELSPDRGGARMIGRALPSSLSALIYPESALIVTSFAPVDKICPLDCSQPTVCPLTGTAHAAPMHDILNETFERLLEDFVVLISHQLGSFGALEGSAVERAFRLASSIEEGRTLGIATACRCHGIVSILRSGRGRL
jgi:hypothetical protein